MKKHLFSLVLMLMTFASYHTYAQVPGLPNPSSTQTIIQEFGLGKVNITYSRPNVRGREIFGNLVPYGQVWRTGANTSTSIAFTEDVIIEGHDIPAGTYTLFCIPEKTAWTIILNKAVGNWGAYTYKEADDLIRFKVKPTHTNENQESFTVLFANSTNQTADLSLIWDHTKVTMQMKTNDDAKIMANIDQLMSAKEISNLVYFNAIQYYYLNHKDVNKALGWISDAEKVFPKRGSYRVFRSRFLLRKGDKAGAIAAAEEGIKISKESKDEEYLKLNQVALAQAKR